MKNLFSHLLEHIELTREALEELSNMKLLPDGYFYIAGYYRCWFWKGDIIRLTNINGMYGEKQMKVNPKLWDLFREGWNDAKGDQELNPHMWEDWKI